MKKTELVEELGRLLDGSRIATTQERIEAARDHVLAQVVAGRVSAEEGAEVLRELLEAEMMPYA